MISSELLAKVASGLLETHAQFDNISQINTARVLEAFRKHRVSDACFAGTTGYGYNDHGRDVLEKCMADIMGAEAALMRVQFVSGTHTIACALCGILRPNDVLLSVTGTPYDTLHGVIGSPLRTPTDGAALSDFGVLYREVALLGDGTPDYANIQTAVQGVKAVLIQRSRGYSDRPALGIETVAALVRVIRAANSACCILVDNCYCEFVSSVEPCMVGADLVMGSLIKNPGGGLAPTGGYVAGRADLVQLTAQRLTAPGIGAECGSSLGQNRLLYQGLFMAPHTVAQALKTVSFAAALLTELGYTTDPAPNAVRADIIQMLHFNDAEAVISFCRGIQAGSPVDAFAVPEPGDMPGYDSPVIMAAGTFIQGGSIELSCDAPMRPPFTAYLQGGLTYEAGRYGVINAVNAMLGQQQ